MELKQEGKELVEQTRELLIVPYGIETQKPTGQQQDAGLLIVPYGIETKKDSAA